jgi:hypothetical protein
LSDSGILIASSLKAPSPHPALFPKGDGKAERSVLAIGVLKFGIFRLSLQYIRLVMCGQCVDDLVKVSLENRLQSIKG